MERTGRKRGKGKKKKTVALNQFYHNIRCEKSSWRFF